MALTGCSGSGESSGKTEIEILQYKPEAATYFDQVEEQFNATHDDIHLTIDSPNDASTIMRTRFIREDYPDIIGIGGDINYSYYVDAEILADVSDYAGMADIKDSYIDIAEALEIVPTDGTYIVPYVANAAGILYNRDMFEEHGWEIPTNWGELMSLCEEIQAEGILPFYFGFRDTWTCLAPWNAIAVDLAPADLCKQVNRGEANFTEGIRGGGREISGAHLLRPGGSHRLRLQRCMYSLCKRRVCHVPHRKLRGAPDPVRQPGDEHRLLRDAGQRLL